MTAPSAMLTSGTDHHERLDRNVATERRISGEIDGIRRDQRHASIKRGLPQPALHHLLGFRELGLGIDPAHFVFVRLNHTSRASQVRARWSRHR